MPERKSFFHRTESKHWQEHSYRNPFIKKTSGVVWKKFPFLLSGGCVALALLIGLLFLPWFRIHTVTIQGALYVPSVDLEYFVRENLTKRRWGIIPKDHRFFFSQKQLEQDLLNTYPLRDVHLSLKSNTLVVQVDERVSRLYWEATNGRFVVDEHGTILYNAPPEPETTDTTLPKENVAITFPTVSPFIPSPVSVEDHVLPDHVVTNLLNLLEELTSSPLVYDRLEIDTSDYHLLRMGLSDGYDVFFDPTVEMISQLARLITVLKGEATDPSNYEYIDVRFGERVYVKEKR